MTGYTSIPEIQGPVKRTVPSAVADDVECASIPWHAAARDWVAFAQDVEQGQQLSNSATQQSYKSCNFTLRSTVHDAGIEYYLIDQEFYTLTLSVQRLPKHAHLLHANATKLNARTAQKNPTIGCGPTFSTNSPLIGIQIRVARLATKYIEP